MLILFEFVLNFAFKHYRYGDDINKIFRDKHFVFLSETQSFNILMCTLEPLWTVQMTDSLIDIAINCLKDSKFGFI